RLDEQRLVGFQRTQRFDDALVALPVARRLADAAVDDELLRPLRDLRIEIVHQHPQRRFGEPALRRKRGAARGANGAGTGCHGCVHHNGSLCYLFAMKIVPSGKILGATVEGVALARPLAAAELDQVMQGLGRHGVLRFPGQKLDARQLRDFSAQLGDLEINVASGAYQEPGIPEVMTLSNIVENGKAIGLAGAGQDWHTDMSYSRGVAFANVLYGIKIPRRDGKPLGSTDFCNMHAAYDGLPSEV